MKRLMFGFVALLSAWACGAESHAEDIVARVRENVAKIRAADPQAVPMAFWDFDGTIIKGDISEGLCENGRTLFKGLVERTIEEGLNTVYPPDGGWAQYQALPS